MFFRATLFSAFGEAKRWLGTNADGTKRALQDIDYFKAGMITGFVAAFTEAPIDFYKSQIQVQIIRSKANPSYVRTLGQLLPIDNHIPPLSCSCVDFLVCSCLHHSCELR